ncbi:MAG: pantoate--beta-alanine ligase [Clostridiales Family XIII bacterium]|jgi:pantoate--beta-alanine ligase|nr:pantoate--beta-alanine ligase [Clostridiales Family XIII bacterium]
MTLRVYRRIDEVREALRVVRSEGRPIGFVPTMGALHRGHASLIVRSEEEQRPENGLTVVSIFINPIQFEDRADFSGYPRTLDDDVACCEEAGADMVFVPSADEIYPEGFSTFVDTEGAYAERLCGRARPGHFRGVLTVVSKLFNIVQPTRAYFGEKDAQQLFLLERMAKDLNTDIRIVGCPTVREADGLALSSRNGRLSPEERRAALCLVRALEAGKSKPEKSGNPPRGSATGAFVASVKASMSAIIEAEPLARLDYAEILDEETFGEVCDTTTKALLAVAAFFGETRLIDNTRTDTDFRKAQDERR